MHMHKKGELVWIFQMSPAKGLFVEGRAAIIKAVPDIDSQYVVRFGDEKETVERFVDSWGQSNPTKYVEKYNKRIGY